MDAIRLKLIPTDTEDLNTLEPQIDRSGLIQKYSNFFKMKKLEIDKDVLSETSNFDFYQL